MDGPEAGQTYTCASCYQLEHSGGTGATISGCSEQSYLNWASGELAMVTFRPRCKFLQTGNEDYMHVYGDP